MPRSDVAAEAGQTPWLDVEGYEGPLDLLLELVKRHKLDLAKLPLLPLIEQFIAALADAAGHVPLDRQGDWVVQASQLVLLRAQLLRPTDAAEAEDAVAEAGRRVAQLNEMLRVQAAAAWLAARPQLHQDRWDRGLPERWNMVDTMAERQLAFWEALLAVLEPREGEGAPAALPVGVVWPREVWRVPDALAHIRRLLLDDDRPLDLLRCLPDLPAVRDHPVQRRAALASSFVAALELEREGKVTLVQEQYPAGILMLRSRHA